MDISIYNHNGSVTPNKINSNFSELRIHTNPYATFNDCLTHVCFLMESRCNKVNCIGLWCLLSFSFLEQFLHSLFIFHLGLVEETALTSFKSTWDVPVEKSAIFGWQTETCQHFQICILAIGAKGQNLSHFCLFNDLNNFQEALKQFYPLY